MRVEREVQDRLHAAVLAGDPTASARVFAALLEPLIDWLGFRWLGERGSERLRDFAIDSIINYLEDPSRYDSAKASLLTYLRMDAHGDLLNDEARWNRERELKKQADVELAAQAGKVSTDDYPSDREPPAMSLAAVRNVLPDERDRRAVLLMMEGERSTAAFAEIWGIAGLPREALFVEVKRNKDRVKARLRRLRKEGP